MGFDANVEFLRIAFWQILITAGPLLGMALAIGLLIGIIQAATSINEMTLSFVPKLIVVVLTFGLLSNFMLLQLSDYFQFTFDQIAQVGLQIDAGVRHNRNDEDAGGGLEVRHRLPASFYAGEPAHRRVPAVGAAVRRPLDAASGSGDHGLCAGVGCRPSGAAFRC